MLNNVRKGILDEKAVSEVNGTGAPKKALFMSGTTRDAIDVRDLPLVARYREDKVQAPVAESAPLTEETPLVNPEYTSNPFVRATSNVAGFDVTQAPPREVTPEQVEMPSMDPNQIPTIQPVNNAVEEKQDEMPNIVPPTFDKIEPAPVSQPDDVYAAINATLSREETSAMETPVVEPISPIQPEVPPVSIGQPVESTNYVPQQPISEQPIPVMPADQVSQPVEDLTPPVQPAEINPAIEPAYVNPEVAPEQPVAPVNEYKNDDMAEINALIEKYLDDFHSLTDKFRDELKELLKKAIEKENSNLDIKSITDSVNMRVDDIVTPVNPYDVNNIDYTQGVINGR